jgi:hypothetical protein
MAYNVNPMQLVAMIRNGQNPQQLMLSILQQNAAGNPLYENLLSLAQNNDTPGIEKIARVMFAERGLDFDKEFNSFKATLGL